MDGAAPSDEPLRHVAAEVADTAGAIVSVWQQASRSVSPQLSPPQLEALLILWRCPGVNLTGLADEVGATLPAVSRLCDRLEAAGLLRRERAPTSRRELVLLLTSQGKGLVEALFARRHAHFGEVLGRMAAGERAALLTGLRAFSKAGRGDGG